MTKLDSKDADSISQKVGMQTALDWSDYENSGFGDPFADVPKHGGHFAKAISVCINSLQCVRPIERGVMCPSYRVTNNANNSPGGRIRLLKAALNADDYTTQLNGPEIEKAMALCVGCKGCKRECDSNVDMAAVKVEYLAHKYRHQKIPMRERLFAELPFSLARFPFAKLIKLRNKSKLLSVLGEIIFGINRKKHLPVPANKTFYQTHHSANLLGSTNISNIYTNGAKREVALLVDTFSNHFDPNIVKSAINVLQHFGYSVIIPKAGQAESSMPLCCGRTFYSTGAIKKARREAKKLLVNLEPLIEQGIPIIGLEPSCLLMLRDEYLMLNLGPLAKKASKLAFLFEEFLAKESAAGRLQGQFSAAIHTPKVMVHGHCHQKSVGAMKSVRKVLKLIPNLQFEIIDNSCCGAAGSFAFEAEHAEVADQMAAEALKPIRETDDETVIVSNGFSCRHQIRSAADRSALHLASYIESYIQKPANLSDTTLKS